MKVRHSDFEFKPERTPIECPICHYKIVPVPLVGTEINKKYTQIAYECNNPKCRQIFIATFEYRTPVKMEPKRAKPMIENEKIKEISPNFYKIYNQSSEAESLGLDEIAGVGYRKSLEFLIKDYCMKENEGKEEDIQKRPITQVINTYMNDAPKVKSCAMKAVWLGNDETHYVKKWEDKDIKDLKLLISLTIHYIESELISAEFEADMG